MNERGGRRARDKTSRLSAITESKEDKNPEMGNGSEAGKKRIIVKIILND